MSTNILIATGLKTRLPEESILKLIETEVSVGVLKACLVSHHNNNNKQHRKVISHHRAALTEGFIVVSLTSLMAF